MRIIKKIIKIIFSAILTISILLYILINLLSSTILKESYILSKLDQANFYQKVYEEVNSNFEKYIYQSGLDEDVLKDICSQDKVKSDINIMLANIYEGTNKKIDTTEISQNLNANIDKLNIKNTQNSSAINEFVNHICQEYTDTLVHSKYESEINRIYKKGTNILNEIYKISLVVLAIDGIVILIINKKKISKDFQHWGIALMATSAFEIISCQIISSKVNIKGIKIFNDIFSNSLVTIIQDVLNKINSLALGTCMIAIILLGIYVSIKVNKKTKE